MKGMPLVAIPLIPTVPSTLFVPAVTSLSSQAASASANADTANILFFISLVPLFNILKY